MGASHEARRCGKVILSPRGGGVGAVPARAHQDFRRSLRAKQHFHPAGSWPGGCGARGRRRGRSSGEEGQPGAELLSWGAASGEEAPAFDILLILGFGSGLKSREHDPVLDGLNLFEGSPLPDSSNIVTGAY